MKILIFALTFAACALTTQAQSLTNVTLRFTVNGVNTTLNIDSSTKKDAARLAGLSFAYGSYTNSAGTNTPLAFDAWLKQNYLDFIESYKVQKQQADNAAILAKLQYLLLIAPDVLLPGDFTSLNAVAAKAP